MVDMLYSVIGRPIANEPDQKDAYHVDKAPKDAKVKKTEEDDPQEQGRGSSNEQDKEEPVVEAIEKNPTKPDELTPKKKGKGAYIDDDGNQRLDFYV